MKEKHTSRRRDGRHRMSELIKKAMEVNNVKQKSIIIMVLMVKG